MRVTHLVVLCLLVSLPGCTTRLAQTPDVQILAPGMVIKLPATPPFGTIDHVVQIVQARYQNKLQSFESIITSTPTKFSMVMLMPSGPRVMRIDWVAPKMVIKREAVAPAGLPGERILADIMLVYASDETLKTAIRGGTIKDVGSIRSVYKGSKEIIRIQRPSRNPWEGDSTLTNFVFGYTLTIQSHRDAQ